MSGVNSRGFTKITVDTAARITVPAGAKGALMQVQSYPVSYRMDGTAPVAVAGSSQTLDVGDYLCFDSWTYPGSNWRSVLSTIQFVKSAGTAGILAIEWFD